MYQVCSVSELFSYRVVYPGGTYIRLHPSQDADNCVEILEFGSIFESTKSVVLDGVNYVFVPSVGWVFDHKDNDVVLKLERCERIQSSIPNATEKYSASNFKTTILDIQRQEYCKWRKLEEDIVNAVSIWDLLPLFNLVNRQPPEFTSIILSSTNLCIWRRNLMDYFPIEVVPYNNLLQIVTIIYNYERKLKINDIQKYIWVYLHLRFKASQRMQEIIEDEANQAYDLYSEFKQMYMLEVISDITQLIKCVCQSLCSKSVVNKSPEEIKSLVQRCIIISVSNLIWKGFKWICYTYIVHHAVHLIV